MAFRGYFEVNGLEIANSSRLVAHLAPPVPTSDTDIGGIMACPCEITVPYDDTWTGLQAALTDPAYIMANAPWYDAARPESTEFAGVWVMEVTGLDAIPIQREITESICAGGVAARQRDTSRVVHFSALVVACTNAGAEYGLKWLNCQLRSSNTRGGVELGYYAAHPQDSAVDPSSLRRTLFGTVLTQPATVQSTTGHGGPARHRQASIYRVEWEMVATRPYAYGSSTVFPVIWTTDATESMTWAHAEDCTSGTGACDLPTIYNADCVPPDVQIAASVIPTCGGCLPVCSIERKTWELPSVTASCDESVVSLRVTNTGTDPLTVNMFWRPCGSTDACDQVFPVQISGLASGYTAVADSVTGRPFVEVGGVGHRQVGIVGTPTGAPWQSTTLDSVLCWELVAEAAPGTAYTVAVDVRERDS